MCPYSCWVPHPCFSLLCTLFFAQWRFCFSALAASCYSHLNFCISEWIILVFWGYFTYHLSLWATSLFKTELRSRLCSPILGSGTAPHLVPFSQDLKLHSLVCCSQGCHHLHSFGQSFFNIKQQVQQTASPSYWSPMSRNSLEHTPKIPWISCSQ